MNNQFPTRMVLLLVSLTAAFVAGCMIAGNNKEAVWCIVYLGIALVITLGRYIVNRFLATATDEEAGIDKGGQGR